MFDSQIRLFDASVVVLLLVGVLLVIVLSGAPIRTVVSFYNNPPSSSPQSPRHLPQTPGPEPFTPQRLLLLHGFPPQRITSIMEEVRRRFLNPSRRQNPTRQTPYFSLPISLPYHPPLSKPLKKILSQHDIKVTHSSSTTLCNLLTKTKTTFPPDLTPHTIYEISCLDCSSTFNGQTYRPLMTHPPHERT
ncbi:hypothetical protein ACHWQZ_G016463 [Mnemiopsis leidyi]